MTAQAKRQRIGSWARTKVLPYEQNAKLHTKEQVEQLAASITQWGWTFPILVDEAGVILAGHGRLLAAELLDLATVPVLVVRGWTEEQKRAYRIADNKLNLSTGWDADLLTAELGTLGDELRAFSGFSADELRELQAGLRRLDRIDGRPIATLIPHARNARLHSQEQIAAIAKSMEHFGFTIPVLIDEQGHIIAGHGRILAAELLGFVDVPVITARGWTDEKKRAYIIADNQLGLTARWDGSLLRIEVGDLKLADYDLSVLGFEPGQLSALTLLEIENGPFDPHAAWQGMPEFEQGDARAFRTLIVHFKDQAGVDAFAEKLGRKIEPATKFFWYPEAEIIYADKLYQAAE